MDETPEFENGVTLTREGETWYVITDVFHPHGADVVGYPSYADAHEGFRLAVEAVSE